MSAICDDSTDPSGRPLTPPRNRALDTRTGGDNLPGQRRRIGDLGSPHDRDWWLKKPIERERVTGVSSTVSRFTRRVIEARRQLRGGPPVVTPPHDVEREVERWQGRRAACRARVAPAPRPGRSRPRWRHRRDDR